MNNSDYIYAGYKSVKINKKGQLTIQAKKEKFPGTVQNFTSARLQTNQAFKYGVFEMRAKLPYLKGTWPTFWLRCADSFCKSSRDGEIDIMEMVAWNLNTIHSAVHFTNGSKSNKTKIKDTVSEFHVYATEWTPTSITTFVDGRAYFRYDKPLNATYAQWPFNSNNNTFNIILNLAIGGKWGAFKGVDETTKSYPQNFTIDYVRVYNYVN